MRTELALDILKLVLLAALYLFFARVLWAVWPEVRTDRRVVASHVVNERAETRAAPVPKPRKAPKGQRGRVGRLVILEPKAKRGTTFALNGDNEITIGRDPGCTLMIDGDTFVSQRHARIYVVDGPADGRGPRLDERVVPQRQPPHGLPAAPPRRPRPGRLHRPGGRSGATMRTPAAGAVRHRPGPHPPAERGQRPRRRRRCSPSPTAWAGTRPARSPAPSRCSCSSAGSTPAGSLDDVLAAVVEANNEIFQAATANVDHQGMGTTLTGLFVVRATAPRPTTLRRRTGTAAPAAGDQSFALINVGDSRTYLLRHGRLRRVTVDHNYVQELVNTGHITDDEARTHPRRNIITRALGIDPSVRVDAWTLPIVRGDRFVLCSDGLSDEVHDTEIHQILTTVDDPQAAADELVAAANRHGGRDNISAIVVDVLEGVDPPAPDEELDIEPVWQPAPPAAPGRSPTRRRPSRRPSRISPPSPAPRA